MRLGGGKGGESRVAKAKKEKKVPGMRGPGMPPPPPVSLGGDRRGGLGDSRAPLSRASDRDRCVLRRLFPCPLLP